MDPELQPTEVGIGGSKEILEPLLRRPEGLDEAVEEAADQQPSPTLPYYPGFDYVHDPRPYRDVTFTITFVILVLASVAWGIFCIANHNGDYGFVDSALYNSSSGLCYTYVGYGGDSKRFFEHKPPSSSWGRVTQLGKNTNVLGTIKLAWVHAFSSNRPGQSYSAASLIEILVWTLVVTLLLSVPFLLGFLWLLTAFAKQLVYACLPFCILIPVFLNVFWFVACILSSECQEYLGLSGRISLFIFVFVVCGVFAWIIYSNWERIELTVKIMQTSAQALLSNWALLLVLPILSLAPLIYILPFAVFLAFAYMNGEIVGTSSEYCQGDAVTDCCTWSADKWVPAYYVLSIFTVLWSMLLMTEARVYVISGTIAWWYFALSGSRVAGSIRHALKNAFGPSFGTVIFSGLVLAFVRMIRAAIDSSYSAHGQQGLFSILPRSCVNFGLSAVEFSNKFTLNFVAITGESFCNSARLSYDLLKRNLLSPVLVEVISTRLLAGTVFVVSVVYAIVVFVILRVGMDLGAASYYVTLLAWLLLFTLSLLFCQVLDNVIDTIYICYAMDKDSGAVSKMEVHDLYLMLPVSREQPPALAVPQP